MRKDDSRNPEADQDTTGRTVVGMFTNREDAERAIRELEAAGFDARQIGMAVQSREKQGDLLESIGGDNVSSGNGAGNAVAGNGAAEGAATGALSGGVVGGLIGLLSSLLIPGVGPLVVGGLLASTLAGAGIGAATGGIIGALVGLGVPEADARHFDEGLRSGRTLVTVDAGARTNEALAILDRHGMDFGPSGASRYAVTDVETDVLDESVDEARLEAIDAGRDQYRGRERRIVQDPLYAGPERRLAGV